MLNRVGKFEKVSLEQFEKDMKSTFGEQYDDIEIQRMHYYLRLPQRATEGSAGYDIESPIYFELKAGETIKIPTGIKVFINNEWFLACVPKSGLGFKYRLQLDNTIGIIDSDYSQSDNEGHIFVKITNDSNKDQKIIINSGEKVCQALFLPFGITYDDNTRNKRNGGFGSTGA